MSLVTLTFTTGAPLRSILTEIPSIPTITCMEITIPEKVTTVLTTVTCAQIVMISIRIRITTFPMHVILINGEFMILGTIVPPRSEESQLSHC